MGCFTYRIFAWDVSNAFRKNVLSLSLLSMAQISHLNPSLIQMYGSKQLEGQIKEDYMGLGLGKMLNNYWDSLAVPI